MEFMDILNVSLYNSCACETQHLIQALFVLLSLELDIKCQSVCFIGLLIQSSVNSCLLQISEVF